MVQHRGLVAVEVRGLSRSTAAAKCLKSRASAVAVIHVCVCLWNMKTILEGMKQCFSCRSLERIIDTLA